MGKQVYPGRQRTNALSPPSPSTRISSNTVERSRERQATSRGAAPSSLPPPPGPRTPPPPPPISAQGRRREEEEKGDGSLRGWRPSDGFPRGSWDGRTEGRTLAIPPRGGRKGPTRGTGGTRRSWRRRRRRQTASCGYGRRRRGRNTRTEKWRRRNKRGGSRRRISCCAPRTDGGTDEQRNSLVVLGSCQAWLGAMEEEEELLSLCRSNTTPFVRSPACDVTPRPGSTAPPLDRRRGGEWGNRGVAAREQGIREKRLYIDCTVCKCDSAITGDLK